MSPLFVLWLIFVIILFNKPKSSNRFGGRPIPMPPKNLIPKRKSK